MPERKCGCRIRAKDRIELSDVRTVKQVKEFRNQVQAPGLAEGKVLQNAEVQRYDFRCLERVSSKIERPCRHRKGVSSIGVKPRQRVDWATAFCREDRRKFDMAQGSRKPASALF